MMLKILKIFKKYQWSLISGLLVGTTYIPFPPWALLFCYIPLWLFVCKKARNWKEAFVAGWWTQFVLTLIGFHWVAYVTKEFGDFPWPLAVLVLILFAAAVHLYIPLTVALVAALRGRLRWGLGSSLLALALFGSLAERIWPSIFPWHLGYTLLWAQLPAYHWADVIGFAGLSTLILLSNAWIAWIWEHRSQKKRVLVQGLALAALLILLNVTGLWHNQPWKEFDRHLNVSLIQANIGDMEKVAAEKGNNFQEEIVRRFMRLSQAAVQSTPQTDLLVWPETAFPDYLDKFNAPSRIPQMLANELQPLGKSLLTGGYSKDGPGFRYRQVYNALFLVDSKAQPITMPYHKTSLLVFGEYLPLSEQFPILLKWLPFIANFGRGQGPEVLHFPHPQGEIKIGAQICYEGLDPAFSRGLAEKQADVIANVTNDSWFGQPFEPRQHLYMTLARAIEVRRPLFRSTNTGISTAILADGTVQQQSPLHEEWQGSYDIAFKDHAPMTAFVLWGHWDWLLIVAAVLILIGRGYLNARTHRP